MREGQGSRTAQWVALLRAFAGHERDPVVTDPVAEHLILGPYALGYQLARRVPRLLRACLSVASVVSSGRSRHLSLRTRAIDDAVVAEADAGTRQLVLLGAGLDARAYRLAALKDTVVFEVDHPSTQREKRARVPSDHVAKDVRFVSVDFARDSLEGALRGAGHEPSQATTFVWEGVTMYLERSAVLATLRTVEALAAPGSLLAMTYHAPRTTAGAFLVGVYVGVVGEPFRLRMGPEEVRELLAARGFHVESDESDDAWGRRFSGRAVPTVGERLVCARATSREGG